jgi:hypothetical protein
MEGYTHVVALNQAYHYLPHGGSVAGMTQLQAFSSSLSQPTLMKLTA